MKFDISFDLSNSNERMVFLILHSLMPAKEGLKVSFFSLMKRLVTRLSSALKKNQSINRIS